MKKIGIVTIDDLGNYGNRLQNYALTKALELNGAIAETLVENKTFYDANVKNISIQNIKDLFKMKSSDPLKQRYLLFKKFNKNISFSKYFLNNPKNKGKINLRYDSFIVGSDQVWNPNFGYLNSNDLLMFVDDNSKKNSYSASFGIEKLPNKFNKIVKEELEKFNNISVRENSGKKIINDLNIKKQIDLLVDPTMLLNKNEWLKVAKKPKKYNGEDYILCYFIGNLSDEKQKEINNFAKKKNCKIYNLLDKNDLFFATGPSEFLYLINNSRLVCTDSFHACVFSVLFNKQFIAYEREDKNKSMNSRIYTLIEKFGLEDNLYKNYKQLDKIYNLKINYDNIDRILKIERKKSFDFLLKIIG